MSAVLRNLHFGFTVSNLERSVAFFRDCLGLEIQERGHDLPDRLRRERAHQGAGGEHGNDFLHHFSSMCGAPSGTAPPAASGRRPDFTSLYQISWCSRAQLSSTTPSRIARYEPSTPIVPM